MNKHDTRKSRVSTRRKDINLLNSAVINTCTSYIVICLIIVSYTPGKPYFNGVVNNGIVLCPVAFETHAI